jgi:hypothetical protein
MSALRSLGRALDALWFAPVDPHPVAAFRILLGLYLLVYFGQLAPHTTLLFSNQGVYVPYRVPDYAPSPPLAAALMAALWLGCLALTLGCWTRWALPLVLVLYLYHYLLGLAVKHSTFERLIAVYLLALLPGRSGEVWSVDAVCARGRAAAAPLIWAFTARIVRFQTIVLYLGAGLWKLGNPEWHKPYLLKSTLHSIWATPLGFGIVRLGFDDVSWTRISQGVMAGEVLLAGLLFFRRTRPFGIVLGVAFHAFNTLVLYLPEFLVCLAPYVFFVEPATIRRIGSALQRGLRTTPQAPTVSPRSRAGG